MVEQAALGCFQEGGYVELPSPKLKPAISKAPQATVAQPATVQSSSWLNP